jgi:tRNA nucleotidyltransferase (CCA-adding enzyme)
MAENGEADALVAERVWQEIARGLMEAHPSRMFEVLHESGALPHVLPEMSMLYRDEEEAAEAMRLLDLVAQAGASLEVRFAVLARVFDPLALESLANRLKAPAACRDLGLLAARHANLIADAAGLDERDLLELLDVTDAWRRPERFAELVQASLVGEQHMDEASVRLQKALAAAAGINAGEIAKQARTPAEIRSRIDQARLNAIREALRSEAK